ncbi:sugar ABC transporter substrate-binding protein [Mesorhizobium sp. B3-1-6]|uniref:sugar ABC transporter substrate-binding protein n=1 Tax=Mesorhizobium sp. B3-1-6 TaxID=2589895 RepID=UPI001FEEF31B|nr:sugar ABC transporter substrate-binding protein [Mesorhizobium sp. B3-1-6]
MATLVVLGGVTIDAFSKDKPYKVYLSLSYAGNDWQTEAENMIRALAASSTMRDKITLEVQVAGPDAQKQSQQINAMAQAGADAIVMYGVSETLLNGAIKNACDRGVTVIAYDSFVSAPCAYNITTDAQEFGRISAEWVVKQMNGKGNLLMVNGVPGASSDQARIKGAMSVFSKHPDIKIVGTIADMWSESVLRSELSKFLAVHSWDDIDGLWIQVGCYTAAAMQDEAGVPDAKKKPCAGEAPNGHRIQMLPADQKVEGTQGAYRPMGYPSISLASPPFEGPLALKYAVDILEGKKLPKLTIVPIPTFTSEHIKLCKTGSWQEMHDTGCNAFDPTIISNPGWFSDIYSPELPEIGLEAALHGKPEK